MSIEGTPAATATPSTQPTSQPSVVGGGVPPVAVPPAATGVLPPPSGQPTPAAGPATLPPEYAAMIQQQQQQMAQMAQTIRSMQGQLPPPPPPVQPEKAHPFGIVPFDQRLIQYLGRDEQGNVVERPGAPHGTAAAYLRHEQSKRDAFEQLVSDPAKLLAPIIQEQAQAIAQREQQKRQDEQYGIAWTQQNADWLYTGQTAYDPATGRAVKELTPAGQQFLQAVSYANQQGYSVQQSVEWARGQMAQEVLTVPPQQLTADQQRMAQKMFALERVAAPQPGLPGTQPPSQPGLPQPPRQTPQAHGGRPNPITPLRERMAPFMNAGAA